MADIFDFYVLDNRRINFEIAEPIMREDKGVTDWVFHIPKILNGIDMSTWAWWLVYTNAKNQKHKEALVLSDDPESPLDSSVGTYTVDYGMSIKAGSVQFALEAINAVVPGGEISGEWHTLTYKTTVKETLQGSEVEIDESQSDIISALIQQIQQKYNALVGGATPPPVNLMSLMTEHDKVYLYTGSEPNESTGYWYYWNGTDFVPGGQYGVGVTDAVPTQGSTNAVSSGGVYEALAGKVDAETGKGLSTNDYTDADKQKVTDAFTGVTSLNDIVNGEVIPPVYTIPSGYESANYSNTAQTNLFKYDSENNQLILSKSASSGSITAGTASLTVDDSLTYTADNTDCNLSFEYSNGNTDGMAVIMLRLYKPSVSQYSAMEVPIPAGDGETVVDVVALAEEKGKDLATYPKVVIYGIKINTADAYSVATVHINGFGTSATTTSGLVSKVSALESGKQDKLTFDITPTENSENPVTSGGIFDALKGNSGNIGVNLYENLYEELGYPNASTGDIDSYTKVYIEKTSDFISVDEGDEVTIQMWVEGTPKGRVAFYDENKAYVSYENIPVSNAVTTDGVSYVIYHKTIAQSIKYIKVGYGSHGISGKIMVTKNCALSDWMPALCDTGSPVYNYADKYSIRGFAHSGKKEQAPENTAVSYVLAAKEGYDMVETDVRFTSDNVPVILHDATINRVARNADGTTLSSDVYIYDITYAQALEYDFGIFFSQDYAGTKILSFEDFIILCKNLNLYAAIEIKRDDGVMTESQVKMLVDIVRKYDMMHRCHFQSYNLRALIWVKRYAPEAWLSMSASSSVSSPIGEGRCIEAQFLQTAFNKVFLCIKDNIPENIALVEQYGIPIYTFATESEYLTLNPLVVGVISDGESYPKYMREHILSEYTSQGD